MNQQVGRPTSAVRPTGMETDARARSSRDIIAPFEHCYNLGPIRCFSIGTSSEVDLCSELRARILRAIFMQVIIRLGWSRLGCIHNRHVIMRRTRSITRKLQPRKLQNSYDNGTHMDQFIEISTLSSPKFQFTHGERTQ